VILLCEAKNSLKLNKFKLVAQHSTAQAAPEKEQGKRAEWKAREKQRVRRTLVSMQNSFKLHTKRNSNLI